jgi:hypothetical protein
VEKRCREDGTQRPVGATLARPTCPARRYGTAKSSRMRGAPGTARRALRPGSAVGGPRLRQRHPDRVPRWVLRAGAGLDVSASAVESVAAELGRAGLSFRRFDVVDVVGADLADGEPEALLVEDGQPLVISLNYANRPCPGSFGS